MGVFFLSWELWQEMTFVLGCSIVLVFGLGLVKLWWTSRSTRKLEVLDAEKRARQSDMSYCGMDAWKVDGIPFGVRAIQRGVEVDGIWISPPDSGDLSQVASSATLIAENGEHIKKGKTSERQTAERIRERSVSESTGSRTDEPLPLPPTLPTLWSQMPATTRLKCLEQPHFDSSQLQETIDMPLASSLDSYVPSGTRFVIVPERRHHLPTSCESPSTPDQAFNTVLQSRPLEETAVFGPARIHVNRDIRRLNKGFEILPAGTFGPRRELQDGSISSDDEIVPHSTEHLRRGKLKKKPPAIQFRSGEEVT